MMSFTSFPRSCDPLRWWRRYAPERTALVDRARGTRHTYAEMDASSDSWAALLRRSGIERGDHVAVIAGNRREVIDLFFACGRVGAVLVPLNWRLAAPELSGIVAHARPAILFGEQRFRALAEIATQGYDSDLPWIDLDCDAPQLLAQTHDDPAADVAIAAEDPALLLYTSGSTGQPKGVMLPHRQIFYNAVATAIAWELGPDDVAPVATPFFHTGGWNVFATPLWHRGGTVVLFDGFDGAGLLEGLAQERCTVAMTVPTQLVMMRESARWGMELPSLRFLIAGGAHCSQSLAAEVRAGGYTFRQGYGLTECGPNCFAISNDDAINRPGAVGWPVPFLEMRVVTGSGSEAASGEPGELLLRGPQLFAGYLRDAERTADALAPEAWLRTGDLAQRDSDGAYYICGRRKEMYISGGENVFPGEVESAIGAHSAVRDVVVIGVSDPLWGEVGHAFVALRDETPPISGAELIAFTRARLAGYKAPRSVVFLADLPRLGSGKPDRRALAALASRPATSAATGA